MLFYGLHVIYFLKSLFHVYRCFYLPVYLCIICMPGAWGGLKRASDSLEELGTVERCHVDPGVKPESSRITNVLS